MGRHMKAGQTQSHHVPFAQLLDHKKENIISEIQNQEKSRVGH
jgi:hypothetical protein